MEQDIASNAASQSDLSQYNSVFFAIEDEVYSIECEGTSFELANRKTYEKYESRIERISDELANRYGEDEVLNHSIAGLARVKECQKPSATATKVDGILTSLEKRLKVNR
ncbi:MAG: hypothetical protein Pars92KO_28050 [Parasphingorhabdus sp.]